MKARDIMTRDPAVVTPDEPVSRAAELMKQRDIGMIPVVNDRSHMRLEGVLTDRDIAIRFVAEAAARDGSAASVLPPALLTPALRTAGAFGEARARR
ncbi:MAG TPA: CBS domain-containing protein [Gemmatimonadaceae bacterium]|nr:CBS domain-containing protein [Gemmatimonadaceae bacterium]